MTAWFWIGVAWACHRMVDAAIWVGNRSVAASTKWNDRAPRAIARGQKANTAL